MLSQFELKKILDYNPITGIFYWKFGRNAGKIAGSDDGEGYIRLVVLGKSYKAHRLAWLYVYGEFPKFEIDHIDGVRSNNRILNLRDVSHTINIQNRKIGYGAGVYYSKEKMKYFSKIVVNKKSIFLGYFINRTSAKEAHLLAVQKYRK